MQSRRSLSSLCWPRNMQENQPWQSTGLIALKVRFMPAVLVLDCSLFSEEVEKLVTLSLYIYMHCMCNFSDYFHLILDVLRLSLHGYKLLFDWEFRRRSVQILLLFDTWIVGYTCSASMGILRWSNYADEGEVSFFLLTFLLVTMVKKKR